MWNFPFYYCWSSTSLSMEVKSEICRTFQVYLFYNWMQYQNMNRNENLSFRKEMVRYFLMSSPSLIFFLFFPSSSSPHLTLPPVLFLSTLLPILPFLPPPCLLPFPLLPFLTAPLLALLTPPPTLLPFLSSPPPLLPSVQICNWPLTCIL